MDFLSVREKNIKNMKIEKIVQSTDDFIEKILEKVKKYQSNPIKEIDNEVIEIPFEEYKHKIIKKLEEIDEKCIICTKSLAIKDILDCGHEFCIKCTKKWRNINNNCPICRKNIIYLS